jgi:cephalosporin-C deacetylase-like acetyl esterase
MASTQLRRYDIEDGQMEAFLIYWHKLIEQRQKFGFRVVFAYVDATNNDLVWAVEHDGDFAAAEAEYMVSPERAAALIGAPQVMRGARIGHAIRVA